MKFVVVDPPFVEMNYWKKIEQLPQIDQLTIYTDPPSNQEDTIKRLLDADMMSADIFIQFDKKILSKAKRLRAIFTQAVGFNNFDIEYARQHDIKIYNTPGFNANAVAEFVFSLIITLLRKIPYAQKHVKIGGWEYKTFTGQELAHKTIGIIGSGNVARRIITIARGFNMNILVHTKHPSIDKAKQLQIEKFYSLKEILTKSDILTISVPLTPETKGLIGKKELKIMKKNAIIVNTSRHTVVDEYALADTILSERIGGAALDVILSEPFNAQKADMKIREMINLPNVIVTPHIAGVTEESTQKLGETVFNNVKSFLQGKNINCVNCEK